MSKGAALYTGKCSGHGTGTSAFHHPGLGGGILGGCAHATLAGQIVHKPLPQTNAVAIWKPHPQRPLGDTVTDVVINGKIPIVMDDLLITHPTKTKFGTISIGFKCFCIRRTPAWWCTDGITGGREAKKGHQRRMFSTTETVFVNGKELGRFGDSFGDDTTEFPCLSLVSGSSEDVFVGN